MPGLTLDAGALIAFEKNDRRVVALLARALVHEHSLAVPAGVVGQVWRDGRRQARLARLLAADDVKIEPLDDQCARAAGQLCGVSGTFDVIDASVVLCARSHGHRIATSDPDDIRTLDPNAPVIVV
jgi:predicted nucleic acid-binding protein